MKQTDCREGFSRSSIRVTHHGGSITFSPTPARADARLPLLLAALPLSLSPPPAELPALPPAPPPVPASSPESPSYSAAAVVCAPTVAMP